MQDCILYFHLMVFKMFYDSYCYSYKYFKYLMSIVTRNNRKNDHTYHTSAHLWDKTTGGMFHYLIPENSSQSFIQTRNLKVKTSLRLKEVQTLIFC